jgi:hypothetical protein
MGDVAPRNMKRLLQWFRELLNRVWRKIKLSRFFLGVIMLSIGVSYTVCFYEGRELKTQYDQSMKIWEEHLVNKASAKSNGEEVSEYYRASETSAQVAENVKGQTSASSIKELSDLIWLNESTRGKNNYSKCEAIGKVNGIGYGIWGGHWQCFESHKEEMEVLEDWIKDKLDEGMSDQELLCLYSGNNYDLCQQ